MNQRCRLGNVQVDSQYAQRWTLLLNSCGVASFIYLPGPARYPDPIPDSEG